MGTAKQGQIVKGIAGAVLGFPGVTFTGASSRARGDLVSWRPCASCAQLRTGALALAPCALSGCAAERSADSLFGFELKLRSFSFGSRGRAACLRRNEADLGCLFRRKLLPPAM